MHRRQLITAVTAGLAVAVSAGLAAGIGQAEPAATPFRVNSTADLVDAQPGDGECKAANGACTLRAAVMEANAASDTTIQVPAGHYKLTIAPPLGEGAADYFLTSAVGNLKLLTPTKIVGAGSDDTVIDGNRKDRVFSVLAPATISDLTITGGQSGPTSSPYGYYGGGGVVNASDLTLDRVHVTRNTATFGGGIFNVPQTRLTLRDSVVDYNQAGEAGGIRVDWIAVVERSVISHNRAINPADPTRPGELAGLGGGIDVRGLLLDVVDSTITDNHATDGGGGINISLAYPPNPEDALATAPGPGEVRLKNTVITGNTGKDCRTAAARITDRGGNRDSDGSCTKG